MLYSALVVSSWGSFDNFLSSPVRYDLYQFPVNQEATNLEKTVKSHLDKIAECKIQQGVLKDLIKRLTDGEEVVSIDSFEGACAGTFMFYFCFDARLADDVLDVGYLF